MNIATIIIIKEVRFLIYGIFFILFNKNDILRAYLT